METFPDKLKGRKYYEPGNLGMEKDIKKRIEWWNSLKEKIKREKS
jgi:putative ATPase